MGIIESYLAAVAFGILAVFGWIVRAIRADLARLEGSRPPRPAGAGAARPLRRAA
jgi:hypothetical protein